MQTIQKIVCGIDFSPNSRLALDQAVSLARALGAELLLVHAIRPVAPVQPAVTATASTTPHAFDVPGYQEALKAQARSQLQEAIDSQVEGQVPVRPLAVIGPPAEQIIQLARAEGAGLIVVGHSGKGALRQLVFGSVARKLVHASPVPVVTVPPAGRTERG